MLTDKQGLPVTTDSPEVINGINTFVEHFLGYGNEATAILEAAEREPDNVRANALSATFHMFIESPAGPLAARPFVEKARASGKATEHEQMVLKATAAWVDNDVAKAIRVHEAIADRYPRDIASAKVCQYHYFNLGDCPGMLRVAEKVDAANDDNPYMYGLAAFAYEQCHLLEKGEAAARKAIALQRKEPWAHHALAHVLQTQDRIDESIEFLESVADTWEDLNSFMHTHNWWHLCLSYLDRDHVDDVLANYDGHIWGRWKEYSQDQIGAVSLLLRLELLGVDVGDRWEDVADYLLPRVDEHVQPFLDMQYLYGLARAGRREADEMMRSIEAYAPTAPLLARTAWTDVCVPASKALLAHAHRNFVSTVEHMSDALPRMIEIGGSHAQRDLFEQVLLDALIKTDRNVPVQQMLELRRLRRDSVPSTHRALSQIYARLGLQREAGESARRAAALHERFTTIKGTGTYAE